MTSGNEGTEPSGGSVTPAEAFGLVGNEVRAEVLRVLSRARGGEGDLAALSFSELRSRIDADVDSSQFNYHLQQLVGTFVERRSEGTAQLDCRMAGDADEGYVLRPEGTILTRTIRGNVAGGHDGVTSSTLDLDCYFCGTAVEATAGNALFMARCPGCEYTYEYDLVPPGALGGGGDGNDSGDEADSGDWDATLARVSRYLRHRRLAFARGGCPRCANGLEAAFVRPEETAYPRTDRRAVLVNRWCERCGERNYLRVGELLLREPALVAFCDAHGVDVARTRLWDLAFAVTDQCVTVRSTDPWAVTFELAMGGETLELVIDDELALVDETRTDRD